MMSRVLWETPCTSDIHFTAKNSTYLCSLLPLEPLLSRSALPYLAAVEMFIAVGSPVPGQGPISYHPFIPRLHSSVMCSIFPFLKADAITPGLCFSTLYHCVWAINISFHIQNNCLLKYLYRTMVVPHKGKQKRKKLTTDTWSIRETAVTARPNEIKLQACQEKLRYNKPDKPQSRCLADSIQRS